MRIEIKFSEKFTFINKWMLQMCLLKRRTTYTSKYHIYSNTSKCPKENYLGFQSLSFNQEYWQEDSSFMRKHLYSYIHMSTSVYKIHFHTIFLESTECTQIQLFLWGHIYWAATVGGRDTPLSALLSFLLKVSFHVWI